MQPHEQYKNVPNKTDETKAEIQQTSNYTKHNCKRQGTESNLTTTNQNAVRRIPNSKIPSEASSVNMNERTQTRRKAYSHKQKARAKREASNTIPPLNPEERGMSGPEPPPTEARLHGWLFSGVFDKSTFSYFLESPACCNPPQAPAL